VLVEEIEGVSVNFVEAVAAVVDKILLVKEVMVVDKVVNVAGMLVEIVGKVVPVEIVIDGPVDMLVMEDELCTVEVVVSGICMLVDDILVAAAAKECVVMLVVLEEFWIVVVFVCSVVIPGENDGGDVPVEMVVDVPV
ncbi:hypothetical protein M9458_014770, partial [Cirrhinus mrigala]